MVSPPTRPVLALAAAAAASLGLTGCMQREAPGRADWSDAPPARVTGEPVNCLRLNDFTETRVRGDRTIDFMRNAREGWRNTLPYSCPGLTTNNAFSYETSISQLCGVDVIHVLYTVGGGLQRGASCGLGEFVPITLAPR